jgi:hypothetical protein
VLSWSETVGSAGRSTESFELNDRTLNHLSNPSEAVPVILSATSDDQLDALCTQGVAGRFAVVSAIREQDIRMAVRPQLMTEARIKTCNRLIAIFVSSLLRTHYCVDSTSSFTSATL